MTGRSLANDFQFNKLKYKQHLQFIYLLFLVYFSSVYLPVIVSFFVYFNFFSLIFINFIIKIIIKLTTLHINRNCRILGKIHTGNKINKNVAMVVATITCNKYLEKAALTD